MFGGLLSLLTGGLTRLLPEIIGIFTKMQDNKHELALGAQQMELAKLQGQIQQQRDDLAADVSAFKEQMTALQSAYATIKTGVAWVDAVNGIIRPYYTFIFIHVWMAIKYVSYLQLTSKGIDWQTAVLTLWTPDDKDLFAGITGFWFVNRVFTRKGQ